MFAQVLVCALGPLAQGTVSPQLLVDLDALAGPTSLPPSSSQPQPLGELNGGLLFEAHAGTNTPQLFWFDGGLASLVALTDPLGSDPKSAVALGNGRAVVLHESFGGGLELIGVDGTAGGTEFLPELGPGSADTALADVVAWRNRGWFVHQNALNEAELWNTDGTAAGTALVETFGPGSPASFGTRLFVAGDRLFIAASPGGVATLSVLDDPLGVSQQIAAQTSVLSGLPVQVAVEFNGELWFAASDSAGGVEPWRSDGTAAGTGPAADLAPGSDDSFPAFLAADDTFLWLTASTPAEGRELYRVDTAGNAVLVSDITPGAADTSFFDGALLPDGRLVFAAGSASAREPWISDGTAAGTAQIIDLRRGPAGSNPNEMTAFNGFVQFTSNVSASSGTWRTDGTAAGTQRLGPQAFFPGSGPVLLPAAGDLYYAGFDPLAGIELIASDGVTPDGASVFNLALDPITGNSDPRGFRRLGSRLLLGAMAPDFGVEPVVTDGTGGGTGLLANLFDGQSSSLPEYGVSIGQRTVFTATTLSGEETWSTDGTTAGTVQLADFGTGAAGSGPSASVSMGDYALFNASLNNDGPPFDRALVRTDGTPAGTSVVSSAPVSIGFPFEDFSGRLGDLLLFRAGNPTTGRELWATDGTSAGTALLAELEPGPGNSDPAQFVRLRDRLVFTATAAASGRELYVSDGTAAGTALLSDILPGPDSSSPFELTPLDDGTALFFVTNASLDSELWRTDGTAAGTQLVAPVQFTPALAQAIKRIGDVLVFTGANSPSGLWRTDGTLAGTQPIPAPAESNFTLDFSFELLEVGDRGHGVIIARAPSVGRELWLLPADGSAPQLLPEVSPGAANSSPTDLIEFDGRLFFAAFHPEFGREIWTLDLVDLGLGGLEPFGEGCSNAGFEPSIALTGTAGIGQTATLRLRDADPAAVALAFRSNTTGFLPLPDCLVYLASPLLISTTVADGAGSAALPIPIPASPTLIGRAQYLQWISTELGGPLAGAFATSNALEVVLGP